MADSSWLRQNCADYIDTKIPDDHHINADILGKRYEYMAHIMGRGARPQPDLQGFLDDGCSLDNRNNLSFDLVRGLDS